MIAALPLLHEPLRKGWCPGARRPMPAKDGLLLRLRISGGILPAAAARSLARAARAHGNGLFDLSSRANLQMRGLSAPGLPALTRILDDLGLLDENPAAEAVRNVLSSPLAGLAAPIDVRPVAKALEGMLVRETRLHALPGKFGFLIDDGGALSLAHSSADIRFDYRAEENAFAIGIGGPAPEAIQLGLCASDEIAGVGLRLAEAFLRLADAEAEPPRRMRDLIGRRGASAIAEAAGLRMAAAARRPPIAEPCPIGLTQSAPEKYCFGIGAAFGRFDAAMLETIAAAAELFAGGEIRLTPWRAILLPGVKAAQETTLPAHFAARAFIIDPADPRLAVAACGGAPACAQGTTPTHADALTLAPIARRLQSQGVALHVSGCAKGCARQAPTAYTLVAAAGRYDLVEAAKPYQARARRGLTLAQAQAELEHAALEHAAREAADKLDHAWERQN
jgi:precorrin-3B synthase